MQKRTLSYHVVMITGLIALFLSIAYNGSLLTQTATGGKSLLGHE